MNEAKKELKEFRRQNKDRLEKRHFIDSVRLCIYERIGVIQSRVGPLDREAVELYTIDIINALLSSLEKEVDFDEAMMQTSIATAVELASDGRLKAQSDAILHGHPSLAQQG